MNWEAIGTIAEVVGAIAVVASLIYLARQIREANQNAAIEANERMARDYASHGSVVMSDENVEVFVRGLENFFDLSPSERVKFDHAMAGYVNLIEATLLHNEAGRIEDVLDMLSGYLGRRLFSYPGAEQWWLHGEKTGFGDYTQRAIDKLIEQNRETPGFWDSQPSKRNE